MGFLEPDILKQLEAMSKEMTLIRQSLETLVELEQDRLAIDKAKDLDLESDNFLYESISKLAEAGQLADRISNALRRANIEVIKDLTYCTVKDIKDVRNLGKKSFQHLMKFKDSTNLAILQNEVSAKLPEINVGDRVVYCGNDDLKAYTGEELHKGDVLSVTSIQKRSSYARFMLPIYSCKLSLTSMARFNLSPGQITLLK